MRIFTFVLSALFASFSGCVVAQPRSVDRAVAIVVFIFTSLSAVTLPQLMRGHNSTDGDGKAPWI